MMNLIHLMNYSSKNNSVAIERTERNVVFIFVFVYKNQKFSILGLTYKVTKDKLCNGTIFIKLVSKDEHDLKKISESGWA